MSRAARDTRTRFARWVGPESRDQPEGQDPGSPAKVLHPLSVPGEVFFTILASGHFLATARDYVLPLGHVFP